MNFGNALQDINVTDSCDLYVGFVYKYTVSNIYIYICVCVCLCEMGMII